MVDPSSYPYYDPKIERRVAVVTGGNLGLGFYTVLHLYLHGYVVYIASRSRLRVMKAIAEIQQKAAERTVRYSPDETACRHLGELLFLELDLLELALVAKAADHFKQRESRLHVLVNNAGVMALPFSLTDDGFEIQLQTNYIAPFLFTMKLLPLLEKSTSVAGSYQIQNQNNIQNHNHNHNQNHNNNSNSNNSNNFNNNNSNLVIPRIVNLLLVGHYFAFRYFAMDLNFNHHPNIVFTWFRYGMAKMASIHFMKMLALRNPQILCFSVHPGFVMNTNLFAYWTRLPFVGILFWCLFQIFGWFFGVSNEEGALALLKCCMDPDLSMENDNGKYFATGGVETSPLRVALNMDYAARTWIWTVKELADRGYNV